MKFDLLTLTNASSKIDQSGISSMQSELERRRQAREKLSAAEKEHVIKFLQSNIELTDEDSAFSNRLQRLVVYVREHA